jgi:hypothetical protein
LAKSIKADAVMSTYPLASAHCIGFPGLPTSGTPWPRPIIQRTL